MCELNVVVVASKRSRAAAGASNGIERVIVEVLLVVCLWKGMCVCSNGHEEKAVCNMKKQRRREKERERSVRKKKDKCKGVEEVRERDEKIKVG